MMPLLDIVLAQAQGMPQTGNAKLDALMYMGGAVLSFMGLREANYIRTQMKAKKNGHNGEGLDRMGHAIEKLSTAIERLADFSHEQRREERQAHGRIEVKVNDVVDELRAARRTGG
jgi:signal transduction histidine kinase